jgi:putative endonuclease
MFVVYVLYSEKFNKHYTGFTSNLEERLKSHFEHEKKSYTSKYRPWKLIYTKDFDSKSLAISHEKWLKSGAGRSFIKNLKH